MIEGLLGEYAIQGALRCALKLGSFYSSKVDSEIRTAYQQALSNWSPNELSMGEKARLENAMEAYINAPALFEKQYKGTQEFIDFFNKRLCEHQSAYNYLSLLEQQKILGELKELKEQVSANSLFEKAKQQNIDPRDISALLEQLPFKEGKEATYQAIKDLYKRKVIASSDVKEIVTEFSNYLFQYSKGMQEEIEQLKQQGNQHLAETLEAIRKVVLGESDESLTHLYETYKKRQQSEEIILLTNLIEAAQAKFSFDEACSFYEELIAIAPTSEYHFNYAYLLQTLNDFEKAKEQYEEALKLWQINTSNSLEIYWTNRATSLNNLGLLLHKLNDFKTAKRCYKEVLNIYKKLAKQNSEAYRPYIATTLNNLAFLLDDLNDQKKSKQYYKEALSIYEDLAKQSSKTYNPNIATILNNIGRLFRKLNDFQAAKRYYEKALKIRRELAKENPTTYQGDVAMTLNNLGNLLNKLNDFERAKEHTEEALEIYRKLANQNPKAYLPDVAMTLNNLGNILNSWNKFKNAKKYYKEALRIYKKLAKQNSDVYLLYVATILNNTGNLLTNLKNFEEAKQYYEKALKIRRELAKENPEVYSPDVATTLRNLAITYYNRGEQEKAEQAYEEAITIQKKLAKQQPDAYAIDYARMLLMGVYWLNKPLKNLQKAKEILQKYPNIPKAQQLLMKAERIEKERQ